MDNPEERISEDDLIPENEARADNPCAICNYANDWVVLSDPTAEVKTVKARGIAKLVDISQNDRNDGLHQHIIGRESIEVHSKCRINYITAVFVSPGSKLKRKAVSIVDLDDEDKSNQATEKSLIEFDICNVCIICMKKIDYKQRKLSRRAVNNSLKDTVIKYWNNQNSKINLVDMAIKKLESVDNVEELNAWVHVSCVKKIYDPKEYQEATSSGQRRNSIEALIQFIEENPNKCYNIADFETVLKEKDLFIPNDKYIWDELENHFQDRLIKMNRKGALTHCCLSNVGFDVLRTNRNETQALMASEILEKAAKIILEDIETNYTSDYEYYPPSNSMFEKAEKLPIINQININ